MAGFTGERSRNAAERSGEDGYKDSAIVSRLISLLMRSNGLSGHDSRCGGWCARRCPREAARCRAVRRRAPSADWRRGKYFAE